MAKHRWGILATGIIAHDFARALQDHPDAEVVAVASRTKSSADAFADRWSIKNRHGSYAGLMDDTEVDIVYIATPHTLHHENMHMALEAGKHVLCEKPLTINAAEAIECRDLAKKKQCFLMEAVWMRFFPAIQQAHQWIREGLIGSPCLFEADFSFLLEVDPQHRLFDRAIGGGSLLDLGVYPLSLAIMLFGVPHRVRGEKVMGGTGVDIANAMVCQHDHNVLSLLSTSTRLALHNHATAAGDKGRIEVHPPFHHPDTLTFQPSGKTAKEYTFPVAGTGYEYEISEVHSCIERGDLQSAIMPLSDTIGMMSVMDTLRAEWGIVYPQEM